MTSLLLVMTYLALSERAPVWAPSHPETGEEEAAA